MPITKTITLYKFSELGEKAQEKALEKLYDLNICHDWWDHVIEDAAAIGLDIWEWCLDKGEIKGGLNEPLLDVCKLIRTHHGKQTETFKTAKSFHRAYIKAFLKWKASQDATVVDWKPKEWFGEFEYEDEAVEVKEDFTKALLECYRILLEREYDYLTSREAIIETIEANQYLFTEDGVQQHLPF